MTVTPTNFQDRPHSAWGFHHVRELHPTAQVWRGVGPVWELPQRPADLEGVAFQGAGGQPTTLAAMMAEPVHDGLIVLHRGAVVFEAYGSGMRPRDPHILMSTTKSFAGSLAGILADQGVLDLKAEATALAPLLKGTAYDGATVRQVLDMRVGLDYVEDYSDPACDFAYMDAACGWRPPVEPGAPDNLLDHIKAIRSGPAHGGVFHYVSPTALVMGWVLEAVTGESFAELVSRLIWQPMGAEFDGDLALDRCHRSQTEGGLNVTLRDLARFGELHRLGGAVNGTQIVPEAWLRESTQVAPQIKEHCPETDWLYGNGFWSNSEGKIWPDLPRDAFHSWGAGGHYAAVFPGQELVIVQNPDPFGIRGGAGANPELIDLIFAALA